MYLGVLFLCSVLDNLAFKHEDKEELTNCYGAYKKCVLPNNKGS